MYRCASRSECLWTTAISFRMNKMLPYSCSFATHVNFLENKHRRRKHEIVNGHCEAKLRLQYRPNPLQVVLIKWLCTGAPPVSSYRDPGMNFFHCPGLFTQFTTCLLLNPMLLPTQYPIPLNHAFSRSIYYYSSRPRRYVIYL